MRFMVIVKANAETEAGQMPTAEEMAAMGRYNEAMVRAGVTLAGEGLLPSSKGVRARFGARGECTIAAGPFAQPEQLIAGFWLIETRSRAEAIEWVKRCPMRAGAELELRQVAEAADFPSEVFTPEEAAREERLREKLQRRAAAR